MVLRPRMARAALFAVLCGGASGCDPDAAVFVEADVEDVALAAQTSALNTGVGGLFTITLHLGGRASGASEVGIGAFSITDASRSETLVPTLGFTTDRAFPIDVDPDSTIEVQATLTPEENLVEADLIDALCDPAGVVVVGALDDSLRGGTIDLASEPTPLTGCP